MCPRKYLWFSIMRYINAQCVEYNTTNFHQYNNPIQVYHILFMCNCYIKLNHVSIFLSYVTFITYKLFLLFFICIISNIKTYHSYDDDISVSTVSLIKNIWKCFQQWILDTKNGGDDHGWWWISLLRDSLIAILQLIQISASLCFSTKVSIVSKGSWLFNWIVGRASVITQGSG